MRNHCILTGTVIEKFHPFTDAGTNEQIEHKGEKLYEAVIGTKRLSGVADIIRIVIPERKMEESLPERIHVHGTLITMNDSNRRLILFVLAETIEPAGEKDDFNEIELTANICKVPVFRTTPLKRNITDLLLANNQYINNEKVSSYIPAICWGSTTKKAADCQVGDLLKAKGRINSREYTKVMEDGSHKTIRVNEYSIYFVTGYFTPQTKE